MEDKYILVGSTAFFKDYSDFKSKDVDYVRLTDNPKGFKVVRQISGSGSCLFEMKRMTAQEYIDYALSHGAAMQVGKFLVPEFINEIGLTIEQLKQLSPLIDNLEVKHKYESLIYNDYIENNAFILTDEQLLNAYNSYKEARGINENKSTDK